VARDIIRTGDAPSSPIFSQAVRAGGLIFVSGQAPIDPATGKISAETIQEQTRQSLTNIQTILTAAGSSLDKIVSATVILVEESDFAGMNEEWARWFPADPPARQGARLPISSGGIKVSVAVIAQA
jgi:2-iminobutanoate/2-iminopropanoate deaminase